jgi:CRISPR-associated protein Cas1
MLIMPTACLNQPNLKVNLVSERLEVVQKDYETGEDKLLREIPLYDLERVVAHESVYFTNAAIAELLRRGIPIQIFSWSGEYLGGFLPAQNRQGLARLNQYRASMDEQFKVRIAGKIVAAKIYNQRRALQRLLSGRTTNADDNTAVNQVSAVIDHLARFLSSVSTCQSVDELRGYEGAATAKYFQAWAMFLPEEFPFEGRSTRPPLNPVNACISFCATILYSEAAAFITAHGLDPGIGILHTTEDNRLSLALDLIEPFRPALVEALTLDLFSHQILNKSHFEKREGGVYLNQEGRKKFFFQYERRMERQFMSEAAGHRTTLRQQLENQATMFKAAFDNIENFEPFLMN